MFRQRQRGAQPRGCRPRHAPRELLVALPRDSGRVFADARFHAPPRLTALIALAIAAAGCGGGTFQPRTPHAQATPASPLGASYVLVPLPSEDSSLLGRVLPGPPEPGRSLAELAQPNACAETLSPAQTVPMSNSFENAEDLTASVNAGAALGAYGFRADVSRATHFVYKVATDQQMVQRDTAAYVECCKTKGCGWGYVAELIHGNGEYASAEETRGSAQVDFAIASGGGSVGLKAISRRKVDGWVAALVKVNPGQQAKELGALGVPSSQVNVATAPEQYKQLFEKYRVNVCAEATSKEWKFCDAAGPVRENEFVRRYREETGSDELDGAERHRSPGLFYGGLAVTGVSLGLAAVFVVATPVCADSGRNCDPSYILAGGAALPAALGLVWALLSKPRNGEPTDHSLTESDGRFYADQYNRALLRRIIRDAQRGRGGASLLRAQVARRATRPRAPEPVHFDFRAGPAAAALIGTF